MSDGAWLNGTLNSDRSRYHNDKDTHHAVNFKHPRIPDKHFKKLSLIQIALSRICFLRRGLVSLKDPGWYHARCHAGLKTVCHTFWSSGEVDDNLHWSVKTQYWNHYIHYFRPRQLRAEFFFASVLLFAFCSALLAWYHVSFGRLLIFSNPNRGYHITKPLTKEGSQPNSADWMSNLPFSCSLISICSHVKISNPSVGYTLGSSE